MNSDLAKAEAAVCDMTKQGKIIEGIDQYYADHCVFTEADGSSRANKAAQKAHLGGFFSSLKSFDGATLHAHSIGDNVGMSEWTFKMTGGDGKAIVWNEVLVRKWQNGKVVSEKYYVQS